MKSKIISIQQKTTNDEAWNTLTIKSNLMAKIFDTFLIRGYHSTDFMALPKIIRSHQFIRLPDGRKYEKVETPEYDPAYGATNYSVRYSLIEGTY